MTKRTKNHSSYSTNYHPEQKNQHRCALASQCRSPQWGKQLISTSGFTISIKREIINLWPTTTTTRKKNPWWSSPPSWLVCRCEAERSDTDWWRVEPNVRPTSSLTLLIALAFFLPQEPVKNELWASLPLLSSWEWFWKICCFFNLKIGQLGCKLLTWGLRSGEEKRMFFMFGMDLDTDRSLSS